MSIVENLNAYAVLTGKLNNSGSLTNFSSITQQTKQLSGSQDSFVSFKGCRENEKLSAEELKETVEKIDKNVLKKVYFSRNGKDITGSELLKRFYYGSRRSDAYSHQSSLFGYYDIIARRTEDELADIIWKNSGHKNELCNFFRDAIANNLIADDKSFVSGKVYLTDIGYKVVSDQRSRKEWLNSVSPAEEEKNIQIIKKALEKVDEKIMKKVYFSDNGKEVTGYDLLKRFYSHNNVALDSRHPGGVYNIGREEKIVNYYGEERKIHGDNIDMDHLIHSVWRWPGENHKKEIAEFYKDAKENYLILERQGYTDCYVNMTNLGRLAIEKPLAREEWFNSEKNYNEKRSERHSYYRDDLPDYLGSGINFLVEKMPLKMIEEEKSPAKEKEETLSTEKKKGFCHIFTKHLTKK